MPVFNQGRISLNTTLSCSSCDPFLPIAAVSLTRPGRHTALYEIETAAGVRNLDKVNRRGARLMKV
jgi:hypothetical protein